MKTKKILSLALAAIMIFSMGITSLAANITTDGGAGTTRVTYGMDESFILTIPDSSRFEYDEMFGAIWAGVSLTASEVMIGANNSLKVYVSTENFDNGMHYLVDAASADNKLAYTITDVIGGSERLVNGDLWMTVASGETADSDVSVSKTLLLTTSSVEKAGTYNDTLTFTAAIEQSMFGFYIEKEEDVFDGEYWAGTELVNKYYRAEVGMTWEEWYTSEYNTGDTGTYIDGNNIRTQPYDKVLAFGPSDNLTIVELDDLIIGGTYYVGHVDY